MLSEEHLGRGLVIVLPGIEGRAAHNERVCRDLCDENIGLAVELYDWTIPFGLILNQCVVPLNRLAAKDLAARIVRYHKDNPGRPVFLIGHSGGTAIAVWAAEELPQGETIDGIVLLASSLSPEYDLSNAMEHTEMGIVNFCSDGDAGLLGLGTLLFGTMDGRHGEAAGKVGFRRPARLSEEDYGRLFEVRWDTSMAAVGNDGGHFGCISSGFIRSRVAPLIAGVSRESYPEADTASKAEGIETQAAAVLAMNESDR
jgi:pimeloyl-ACP methyl ester carboxylesterase